MKIKITVRYPAPTVTCKRHTDPQDGDGLQFGLTEFVGLGAVRVVHHSPAGWEWGYCGSGPADLALNILHICLPVGCDGEEPVKLYRGKCSQIAWTLHQDFKVKFVAPLPRSGGVIDGAAVDLWIDEQLLKQGDRETVFAHFPDYKTKQVD